MIVEGWLIEVFISSWQLGCTNHGFPIFWIIARGNNSGTGVPQHRFVPSSGLYGTRAFMETLLGCFLLWSLPRNGWQAVLLLVALSVRFIASFIRTGFGKNVKVLHALCAGLPILLQCIFSEQSLRLVTLSLRILSMLIRHIGFRFWGCIFQVAVLTISERNLVCLKMDENGKYPQFICILKGLMMIYRWTDCGFPSIYRHSESPLQNGTQLPARVPSSSS